VRKAVTLIEIIVVIIIVGVLATLAIPQFTVNRERSLGYEAKASLKLISAAQKLYRLELASYYPGTGIAQTNLTAINANLKLSLGNANWAYAVNGTAGTFNATADRNGSGGYLDCQYSIVQDQDDPTVSINTCP